MAIYGNLVQNYNENCIANFLDNFIQENIIFDKLLEKTNTEILSESLSFDQIKDKIIELWDKFKKMIKEKIKQLFEFISEKLKLLLNKSLPNIAAKTNSESLNITYSYYKIKYIPSKSDLIKSNNNSKLGIIIMQEFDSYFKNNNKYLEDFDSEKINDFLEKERGKADQNLNNLREVFDKIKKGIKLVDAKLNSAQDFNKATNIISKTYSDFDSTYKLLESFCKIIESEIDNCDKQLKFNFNYWSKYGRNEPGYGRFMRHYDTVINEDISRLREILIISSKLAIEVSKCFAYNRKSIANLHNEITNNN